VIARPVEDVTRKSFAPAASRTVTLSSRFAVTACAIAVSLNLSRSSRCAPAAIRLLTQAVSLSRAAFMSGVLASSPRSFGSAP